MKFWKKYRGVIIMFLVLLIAGLALYYIRPSEIIERLGVRNSYLVAFLFAFFGGVSTFTSSSFYITVAAFAAGGLNPILLALSTAPGLFIGDIIFYYFGLQVEGVIPERYKKPLDKLIRFFEHKKNSYVVPIVVFLYAGFSPLPGDILMFALALMKYPPRKFVFPLFLGAIVLILNISLLARAGVVLFGSS